MLVSMEDAIIIDFQNAFKSKMSICGSRKSISPKSVKQIPTLFKQHEKINFNESMVYEDNIKDKNCDTGKLI